jgi:RimJ/RimL family protein N-acetyltransferase
MKRAPPPGVRKKGGLTMRWTVAQLRRTLPLLIAKGETLELAGKLAGRIYSDKTWYVLRRDPSIPFIAPPAKIPIRVRPAERADYPAIIQERPARLPALEAGLSTCYVATTDKNDICYMQWLIDSEQNELIGAHFKGMCSPLNDGEMMLEWAYTFKKFRGLGIMAPAMSAISEQGAKRGARSLITFVEQDNMPSLKGCRSAGYRPYKIRRDRWRFFRKNENYIFLPPNAKYPFENEIQVPSTGLTASEEQSVTTQRQTAR